MSAGAALRAILPSVLPAAVLFASPVVPASGAEALSPPPRQGPFSYQSALRAGDVQAFFDRTLWTQLGLHGIPGAAIAVVQGNKTLYLGGYGQADIDRDKPVSPKETLFRTGSVSKLVTWTAVMRLVEQGRLDLHSDVNRYLNTFQIPATYPEPVTLAHLLTHTAGFEDRSFGFYARSQRDLVPLGAFLAERMPARIFPSGEVSAYSNYGAALAGYLVARVSGMPFEDYVESRILTPLGMSASSFHQPLPPVPAARLATGYRTSLKPGELEWDLAVPAGGLSSTAADMARFMAAHLNGGCLGTTRILKEETGYNADDHVETAMWYANQRANSIGLAPVYQNAEHRFPWMSEQVSMRKEKNFFETRPTEYRTGGALSWDD